LKFSPTQPNPQKFLLIQANYYPHLAILKSYLIKALQVTSYPCKLPVLEVGVSFDHWYRTYDYNVEWK